MGKYMIFLFLLKCSDGDQNLMNSKELRDLQFHIAEVSELIHYVTVDITIVERVSSPFTSSIYFQIKSNALVNSFASA